MKTVNTLEQLVLSKLAGLFNAKLDEFTFYTSLPCLPDNENDFAQFLDSIPLGNDFLNLTKSVNYFSQVYDKILKAQKTSPFAIEIGRNKFNDKSNWLSPYTIPKYTPTLELVNDIISDGGKTEIIVESNQNPFTITTVPEFPNIVYSGPFLNFFKKVAQSNFTTTVTFDRSANISVGLGNWFFSGAFLYAYQTPDNWDSSIISWDEVFGSESDILKYINSSIAIVSDMTIELVVSGSFNLKTIEMLQNIPDQVIFPFYQQIKNSKLNFVLQKDDSIKISLTVLKKNNYMFGIRYQSVSHHLS